MGKMPCKKGAFLFSALEMVTGLNKDADRILQVADKLIFPLRNNFSFWFGWRCLLLPLCQCRAPWGSGQLPIQPQDDAVLGLQQNQRHSSVGDLLLGGHFF